MASKVIYTVLTGGYDHLQQPLAIAPDWDFVCFTDAPAGRDGVWELRPILYEGSAVLCARWAKMHPHILLPEYELSVFMDANLQIASPVFYEALGQDQIPGLLGLARSFSTRPGPDSRGNGLLQVLPHPQRDCVWEELRYCYLKDKIGTRAAIKWHRVLRKMRMPRHAGLYETGILVRKHNDPALIALDESWWSLLLQSKASRDQLCFTPALHKAALEPALLLPKGTDVRNAEIVNYAGHVDIGPKNTPGKLNRANLKYNLRLLWRKTVLLCLK